MRRIKNLLKKGTSLMLVMAMLMGLCSTGFATGIGQSHKVSQDAKKYVSLGDSMVNGYGLEGYETDELEVNGYLMHAMQSYPCQFAEEFGFEHIPMAISAMRAEDLHFVLEYDWENETQEMKNTVEGDWNPADWEALFSTGDYYTWREFTNHPDNDGRAGRFFDYAGKNTAVVAEEMQTAVAEADIISLGIGNANFGVFLLGRVFEAMSIMGGDPAETDPYQLERALAECDEETRAFVLSVYDELTAEIGDSEEAQTLVRVLTYGVLSYVLNYAGVIERIVELNPDAEIMLVGLINTMYGMKIEIDEDSEPVDLGAVLGGLIGTMNTYLAALPAAFQLAGKYEDATFYYAEASDVELIYTEMADAAEADFEGYETVRDRIVTEVCEKMVFPMLNGVIAGMEKEGKLPTGITYEMIKLDPTFDLERVKAFETAPNAEDALNYTIYMAFEKATIEASKMDSLDVNAFVSLASGLEAVFSGQAGAIMTAIQGVAAGADPKGAADTLATSLNSDETINSLLHLFARMMIGNGIGAHPTADGHAALADAVIKAYDEKNTVDQEVINRVTAALNDVATIIAEYYDEAYEYGYNYAKDNGYIDVAIEALTYAETELTAIEALVMEGEMSDAFRAELANEFATARDTIAQVKVLINEADVLDEATLTEALELLGMLQKNLNNILALLNIAYEDISPVVMAEIKARVEALNAYVENEVIPAVEKAIREAYECAVAYLRDLVAQLEAAVAEMKAALIAHVDEKVAAAIAELEAAIAELKAAVEEQIGMTIEQFQTAVETAVKDLTTAIVELIHAAEQQGENWVEVVVAHFVEQVKAIYADATSGEYVKDSSSYYVAIGDGSIVGESYVGILAKELGVKSNNIGVDGLTIADCAAVLGANAADIFAADLITIGFSNNTMIDYMVAQMKAYLLGNPAAEYDWSKYVTAEGTAYVEQALIELRAELTAMGLEPISFGSKQIDTIEVLMVAIEAYAYSYVGYMFSYPELIKGIREINSDALIVSVGMNNALANVAFNLNGAEFAIGEYVQYLVDAANAEALAFAALTGETVFVDAPAVETIAEAKGTAIESLEDFLFAVVLSDKATAEFYASANGHAYIAEQILNALTVKSDAINVKKGDVNGDGSVNGRDTIIISTAIANRATDEFTAEQFAAADVNGDGSVNGRDTIIISTAIANRTTDEL